MQSAEEQEEEMRAFLSEQCKEIEENNRIGKTSDLLKKIGDIKIGKEVHQFVYYYPSYLTYMQSTSCEMPGWMMHKLELRLLREIPTTSDMQMIPL